MRAAASSTARISASDARQGATPAGIARWRWQPWMAAAAAVVLAVGAFLAGRFTRDAVPPQETAQVTAARLAPEAIRQRVVLAALGEHLDRTERTLVELVNSEPDGRVDISAEQVWARDLLEANRLHRQAAQATPALALERLLPEHGERSISSQAS